LRLPVPILALRSAKVNSTLRSSTSFLTNTECPFLNELLQTVCARLIILLSPAPCLSIKFDQDAESCLLDCSWSHAKWILLEQWGPTNAIRM
jgi:hypothetical protein